MDKEIEEIKHYIEIKDYNSLEEFLSVFMIPIEKIHNQQFDILCYSIENGCNDKFIKQIYEWCNIKVVDYYYYVNNKFISPLLYSFIYKKYEITEFLIKKGANINQKYNNMTLLKYLINNDYFNKDIIPILIKYQYNFSREDFDILFKKDFELIILTFKEITLFNKNNKHNSNNNNSNNNNEKENGKKKIISEKKEEEEEKEKILKQEINIPFMWYINYFKERKFKEILYLFKYETSQEKFNGIKFFDNHFKYLDKITENDIQFQFLYEIIKRRIEIPKFQNENKEDFKNEIHIKNKFKQILIRKQKLYKKILSNNEKQNIEEFKINNKFFLKFIQKNHD